MSLLSARKTALFTGPQGPQGPAGPQGPVGPSGTITGSLAGDVTGNVSATVVGGIAGHTLPSLSAGLLGWTGSAWSYQTSLGPGFLQPGTANQLLDTNSTATSVEWFTLGGDGTFANHNLTVVGLQGVALPSLAAGVLQYTGSAWALSTIAPSSLGHGTAGQLLLTNNTPAAAWVSMVGDVTISFGGSTTVNSISGSSPLSVATSTFQWGAASTPNLSQASTTGATGANFTITPQASTNANGTSGNLLVALTAPTGTGSEAAFQITRSGSFVAQIGPYLGGLGTTYDAVWLGPGLVPSTTNYTFLSSTSASYLNGSTSVNLAIAGSAQVSLNTGVLFPSTDLGAALGGGAARWLTGYIKNGINGGTNAGTTGANFTITPESGTPSGGNVGGGSLIVALQAPTGTGTEAYVQISRGGTPIFYMGSDSGTAVSGIWAINGAPSGTNWMFLGSTDNSSTYMNASSIIHFRIGGSTDYIQISSYGIYSATDLLSAVGQATFRFSAVYAQQGISGGTSTSGAGVTMSITAEAGKSGTNAGGNLYLVGGAAAGSAQGGHTLIGMSSGTPAGQVRFMYNGATGTIVGAVDNTGAFYSFGASGATPSTSNWTIKGDGTNTYFNATNAGGNFEFQQAGSGNQLAVIGSLSTSGVFWLGSTSGLGSLTATNAAMKSDGTNLTLNSIGAAGTTTLSFAGAAGNSAYTFQGLTGTNNSQTNLVAKRVANIRTTATGLQTALTYAMSASGNYNAYLVTCEWVSKSPTGVANCFYGGRTTIAFSAYNGTYAVTSNIESLVQGTSGNAISISNSGANIIVQVSPLSTNTMDWELVVTIIVN